MKTTSTYRTIAIILTGIFCVFSVGLPIVVASCPMMSKSDKGVCSMCNEPAKATAERISKPSRASCCATVIAAERNTTEFLQVQTLKVEPLKVFQAVLSVDRITLTNVCRSFVILQGISSLPPPIEDIPVFNSSLLI